MSEYKYLLDKAESEGLMQDPKNVQEQTEFKPVQRMLLYNL